MSTDAKGDNKVLAAGAEKVTPQPRGLNVNHNEEKNEERAGPGRLRFVAVLLAGLALPAANGACGLSTIGVGPDEGDADVDTEVELDSDADSPEEADDGSDVPDVELDSDVEDRSDIPDVGPDLDAEAMDDAAEDEGAGCLETVTEEPIGETPQPDVGDPSAGGSTQTRTEYERVVEYSGEGCDGAAGRREFSRIGYGFAPPLEDFGAAVRMGIFTSNLSESAEYKATGIDGSGCINTAKIMFGERIGTGMPRTEISDEEYIVRLVDNFGETAGVKWADITIWDARWGEFVRSERANEGALVTLPNGNRLMPTGMDVAGHTVRMDVLEPADYPLCEGARLVRESDSTPFTVRQNLPEGWSFQVEM